MLRLLAGAHCIGYKLWQTLLYATRVTRACDVVPGAGIMGAASQLDLMVNPLSGFQIKLSLC